MATMRLARYIASAGVAARRKAEELIRAGHVRVNGEQVTNVGTNVDASRDQVTVDGKAVVPEALFYAVLNKPKGCITSVEDPWGRATVMDYLAKVPVSVKPVGRLDFYSEGVLLFTNDGELASALLGPKSSVQKTYHVKIRGSVRDAQLMALRKGVRIGKHSVTREAQVDRLKAPSKHDWLVITLTEGKSRQIHRMLEALNLSVSKLQRVAFAGLTFHGLRVGDARELSQGEVNELRKLAGLSKSAAAVGRGVWSARREDSERGRRARAKVRDELGDQRPEAMREKSANAGAARQRAAEPGGKTKGKPRTRPGAKPRGKPGAGPRSHPRAKPGAKPKAAGRAPRGGTGAKRPGSGRGTGRGGGRR